MVEERRVKMLLDVVGQTIDAVDDSGRRPSRQPGRIPEAIHERLTQRRLVEQPV